MAAFDPASRDEIANRYESIQKKQRASVVPTTRATRDSNWENWLHFCVKYDLDPLLSYDDSTRITILCLYADYTRDGTHSRSNKPVRAPSVWSALLAIAERITLLDRPDPRNLSGSNLVAARLDKLVQAYEKEDPAPKRKLPASAFMLRAMPTTLSRFYHGDQLEAIVDLCVIAFFFLCRAGEYCRTVALNRHLEEGHPFRLQDVVFITPGGNRLPAATAPLNDLKNSTGVHLTFSDQKNAVKGETIGHTKTNDPFLCPHRAVLRRVIHMRENNMSPTTPLYTFINAKNQVKTVSGDMITKALKESAKATYNQHGIDPSLISTHSLRSGGATSLLCANVDATTIRLIGRWKSDAMLQYLRTQTAAITHDLSNRMVHSSAISFTQHKIQPTDPTIPIAICQAIEHHFSAAWGTRGAPVA